MTPRQRRLLDDLIRDSLTEFVESVSASGWRGREREAVSLFAFGHLVPRCGPGNLLESPTQIGIEVAVPQHPGARAKRQVCKDLVLWPLPAMTCWDQPGRPTRRPIAILEWKTRGRMVSSSDVEWLTAFSRTSSHFVGYALRFDRTGRAFRLSCTRIHAGAVTPDWLRL
ncbi:MAG: hypothetical protein IPK07_12990 [Deltaproteobacteria bacterium]|nr:hypothetical protein [Deltaproteobacteria bacterium]